MEEENETMRTENTNLTKVAKLLTENMKESVETSKKYEKTILIYYIGELLNIYIFLFILQKPEWKQHSLN